MDDLDRQLLISLQKGIPVHSRPFEIIGRKIGAGSADVLLRLARLKEEGIISRFSALFDMKRLGYRALWAAMKVAASRAGEAARAVGEHPGVFHCLQREGEFNLWFGMMLPAAEPADEHLRSLEEAARAEKTLKLPALKIYKAGFEPGERSAHVADPAQVLDAEEIEIIRRLQDDFPFTDEPYRRIAREAGMNESRLFEILARLTALGILKRIEALMTLDPKAYARHRMIAWQVPEEKRDDTGRRMALLEDVKVCTKRPVYPEFPYSIYTAISASDSAEAGQVALKIESEIGKWPRIIFEEIAEYKRIRPKYFTHELDRWRENMNAVPDSQKGVVS